MPSLFLHQSCQKIFCLICHFRKKLGFIIPFYCFFLLSLLYSSIYFLWVLLFLFLASWIECLAHLIFNIYWCIFKAIIFPCNAAFATSLSFESWSLLQVLSSSLFKISLNFHHLFTFPPVSKKEIYLFLFIMGFSSSNSSPSPGPTPFRMTKTWACL